jgi:hypothetical protein
MSMFRSLQKIYSSEIIVPVVIRSIVGLNMAGILALVGYVGGSFFGVAVSFGVSLFIAKMTGITIGALIGGSFAWLKPGSGPQVNIMFVLAAIGGALAGAWLGYLYGIEKAGMLPNPTDADQVFRVTWVLGAVLGANLPGLCISLYRGIRYREL